jgi:serine protease Do
MLVVAERRCLRSLLACLVAILACAAPCASAETGAPPDVIERAKRATVGILEDTQDPRTPDQPGKIKIRGTGFHLHDGYIVTARHAVEKNSPTGHIVPKVIHVLTTDLHELVAQIVGESAYLDVVVYRLNQHDRPVIDLATAFAT